MEFISSNYSSMKLLNQPSLVFEKTYFIYLQIGTLNVLQLWPSWKYDQHNNQHFGTIQPNLISNGSVVS
jgi:hypothetical protein